MQEKNGQNTEIAIRGVIGKIEQQAGLGCLSPGAVSAHGDGTVRHLQLKMRPITLFRTAHLTYHLSLAHC